MMTSLNDVIFVFLPVKLASSSSSSSSLSSSSSSSSSSSKLAPTVDAKQQ